ncbi:MAG: hypothetical protein AAGN82_27015 [Myxococcota bacterium]
MMTDQTRGNRARLDDLIKRHPRRWPEDVVELARIYATAVGAIDDWTSWLDEASGRQGSATGQGPQTNDDVGRRAQTVVRVTLPGRIAPGQCNDQLAASLAELFGQTPIHMMISEGHQDAAWAFPR